MCFIKNPRDRPDASQLLSHPWIKPSKQPVLSLPSPSLSSNQNSLKMLKTLPSSQFKVYEKPLVLKRPIRNFQIQSFDELNDQKYEVVDNKFISSRNLQNFSKSICSKSHLIRSDLSKKQMSTTLNDQKPTNKIKKFNISFNLKDRKEDKKKVFMYSKLNSILKTSISKNKRFNNIKNSLEKRIGSKYFFSTKKHKPFANKTKGTVLIRSKQKERQAKQSVEPDIEESTSKQIKVYIEYNRSKQVGVKRSFVPSKLVLNLKTTPTLVSSKPLNSNHFKQA